MTSFVLERVTVSYNGNDLNFFDASVGRIVTNNGVSEFRREFDGLGGEVIAETTGSNPDILSASFMGSIRSENSVLTSKTIFYGEGLSVDVMVSQGNAVTYTFLAGDIPDLPDSDAFEVWRALWVSELPISGAYAVGEIINLNTLPGVIRIEQNDVIEARFIPDVLQFGLDAGDDFFQGDDVARTVFGGSGEDRFRSSTAADTFFGGSGEDVFISAPGAQSYFGGRDEDRISYNSSEEGITVNLRSGVARDGFAEGDFVVGIENVTGSRHADKIFGSDDGNAIFGGDGNDSIYARGGNDFIRAGDGDDYIRAGGGREVFRGEGGSDFLDYQESGRGVFINLEEGTARGGWASNDEITDIEGLGGSDVATDILIGDSGENLLRGNGGIDFLFGGLGNDTLEGGAGEDYMLAGGGRETFDGGTGLDSISYYDAPTGVTINLATQNVRGGWASNDEIISIERAIGSNVADDTLIGSDRGNRLGGAGGDDSLFGGGGTDKLNGGRGADFLDGGEGDDWLTGGSGRDQFNFVPDDSRDRVRDFQNNADVLTFEGYDFGSDDVMDFASQQGDHVLFDFGDQGEVLVLNTLVGQLRNDVDIV